MLLRVGNTMSKRWPRNDIIFLVLWYTNDSVKRQQKIDFFHPCFLNNRVIKTRNERRENKYISIYMFRFLIVHGCVILSTFLCYNFLTISLWFYIFRSRLPFLLCIIFINGYGRFQLWLCLGMWCR